MLAKYLAEGEGFEPSIRFPAYTLSKRAPSATRPPLRRAAQYSDGVQRGKGGDGLAARSQFCKVSSILAMTVGAESLAEPTSPPPAARGGLPSVGMFLFGVLVANGIIAAVVHFVVDGKSTAEAWYQWDANSLVGLQALVEKRLDPNPEDPTLYFDVVLPILQQPLSLTVFVVLLVLDIIPLLILVRKLKRKRLEPAADDV